MGYKWATIMDIKTDREGSDETTITENPEAPVMPEDQVGQGKGMNEQKKQETQENPNGPELEVFVPPYGLCEIRWSATDYGPMENQYTYRGPCVIKVFTD
jgi:hypothetical protein